MLLIPTTTVAPKLYSFSSGIPTPPTKKLQERFQKTLDLVQIDEHEKHLYKAFHSYGFDIMSIGLSASRFGVYVGLPNNFEYDSVKDIDKSKIKVSILKTIDC